MADLHPSNKAPAQKAEKPKQKKKDEKAKEPKEQKEPREPKEPRPPPPPLRIAVETKKGIQILVGPDFEPDEKIQKAEYTKFEWAPDGKLLVLYNQTHLVLYDFETGEEKLKLNDFKELRQVWFSPKGTYFATASRFSPTEPERENVIVFRSVADSPAEHKLAGWAVKDLTPPLISWTADEVLAAKRGGAGELFFFDGSFPNGTYCIKVFRVPNLVSFAFSPLPVVSTSAPQAPVYRIAVFGTTKKDQPASLQLVNYSADLKVESRRNFFLQEADLRWNSTGTTVAALCHSDVDRSGRSYYGEDALFLLSTSGASMQLFDQTAIHEVTWAPSGRELLVLHGSMPASASLLGVDGKVRADYGRAPRNTAKFSPSGRQLCIAGFGNLQGDVDIWDVQQKQKLGSFKASFSSFYDWSPDGNYLLTAVLTPRLKVDNELRVWSLQGAVLNVVDYRSTEAYRVCWRPAAKGVYNIHKSPLVVLPGTVPTKGLPASSSSSSSSSSASSSTSAAEATTNGAAKPTTAATTTTATQAVTSTSSTSSASSGGKYRHPNFSGASSSSSREPVGGGYLPNVRGGGGSSSATVPQRKEGGQKKPKKKAPKKKKPQQQAAAVEETHEAEGETETGGAEDDEAERVEKEVKDLTKKLKQIAILKNKQASGQELTEKEKERVAGETALVESLNTLSQRR